MELKIESIKMTGTQRDEEINTQLPDRTKEFQEYKEKTGKDFIFEKAEEWMKGAGTDPMSRANIIDKICNLIVCIPNYTTQDFYLDELAKLYKNKMQWKAALKTIREVSFSYDDEGLAKPGPDANVETVMKFGFYIEDNKYYFRVPNTDGFKEGTNFIIEPLFHIYAKSKDGNKRLIKIINEFNYEKIIDVPSSILPSPEMFQQAVINEGNFLIFINRQQFLKVINNINNKFPLCHELKTLGWQSEGFYAFANGIFSQDSGYRGVDEYGITKHKGENYFSPAFSKVYRDVRQDDDEYENDRNFVYVQSKINFSQWSNLMQAVYGENGRTAVAWTVSSIFRSFIYQTYKIFPHLFYFGEKGSGKSQLGWSISNLFMKGMPPFNLNSGTDVAFARRIGRFRDSVVWFDEYTNNISETRFQVIKSAYDGVGREKGKMTRDSRTEVDKVNAACCVSGQYLPTRDDNALYTRAIVNKVEKKTYNESETREFENLKNFETSGLSSIVTEILQYREVFENYFIQVFQEVFENMKRKASKNNTYFEERIFRNYAIVAATAKTINTRTPISTGFDEKKFETYMYNSAVDQCQKVSDSDALASFWNMVVYLLDSQQIQDRYDFDIAMTNRISKLKNRVDTEEIYVNESTFGYHQVLYLRLDKVHPLYMKEYRSQTGEKGLELSNLKDYIRSHKAYLGIAKSWRFENSNTSAFIFNYEILKADGVNLERGAQTYNDKIEQEKTINQNAEEKNCSNAPTLQQEREAKF